MIPILLLIVGLVLLIALPGLFAGAATVGLILTIVGGLWTLFALVVAYSAAKRINSFHRDLFDRW